MSDDLKNKVAAVAYGPKEVVGRKEALQEAILLFESTISQVEAALPGIPAEQRDGGKVWVSHIRLCASVLQTLQNELAGAPKTN